MKYYVIADPHGFYDTLRQTLEERGFFDENEPCKLIVCGDLMDRGDGAVAMQKFMVELLEQDRLIYVRGNHEDLMERMLTELETGQEFRLLSNGVTVHEHNGTWDTALQLSGMTDAEAKADSLTLVRRVRESAYYAVLMPAAVDYFETERYVFTHGYIPCKAVQGSTKYAGYKTFYFNSDWREASPEDWYNARWYNGMEFAYFRDLYLRDKTVVCGHFHASYGHANIEGRGSEFGRDADFTPFCGKRCKDPDGPLAVIALDACTKFSGVMNCIVIEE